MTSFKRTLRRLLLFALVALTAYQLWIFGWLIYWKWTPPTQTHFMALRLDELRDKNPQVKLAYQWVAYGNISNHLKRAVVAAEDDKFMDHHGFDWDGMQNAFEKNQRRGRSVAGGSTITQQLAKNLFLSPSRSYFRKMEEAVITVMLELLWDKRRILEVYLNVVEWGNGIFGAEAAAQRYYHSSASVLNAQQSAHIAVMLPNPRKFEKRYPDYVARHANNVLARMNFSEIP